MQSNRERVLMLALSGIGNFLMQSPTIAVLRRARPDWHITVWVTPRGTKALAQHSPFVDEVIEAPIKHNLIGHLHMISLLRKKHFDVGIVLSPGQLAKSAAYLYLAGIPKRIGNTYPFRNNPASAWLLTDAIAEKNDLHDIEQNLRLLTPLGIGNNELGITSYDFIIPAPAEKKAKELLHQLHAPTTSKKLVGFHAGSAQNFTWKRWPLEYFAQVGRALAEAKDAHILVFGGPDEEVLKSRLVDSIGNAAVSVTADLLTTAAVMQRCTAVVSNDSGLMHLAAAVGTPTIGIFGPTDENKTGPRGRRSIAIRATGTHPVYDTEHRYALGTTAHETLLQLKPDDVINTVIRML